MKRHGGEIFKGFFALKLTFIHINSFFGNSYSRTKVMAVKSTRWLLGQPETDAPTTRNSVLVIIDAQNEYVGSRPHVRLFPSKSSSLDMTTVN